MVDTPSPAPKPVRVAPAALVVALAVWAASTFGHGLGLEWAGTLFAWAKRPGTWLSEVGGPAGTHRLELVLGSMFLLVALSVGGTLAVKVWRLRPSRREMLEALVPWIVWATATYVIWKCFIVYATEMTHFAQYALVGFLVAWALGRRRRPQLAFLITVGLGVLDELWQHYVLAWGKMGHWMDFTDPVLDALGATGGILPFVTLMRLRKDPTPSTFHYVKRTLVGASVVLLPLTVLGSVTVSKLLGHYRYFPYWGEYQNNKPTHWPGPGEGVPLLLVTLLLLGLILEPRRRRLSQSGLAVVLVLLAVGVHPTSRKEGTPVHEVVPHAFAHKTNTPIVVVDGVLEEAWQKAKRVGPFVLNVAGGPAKQATYARILWDDEKLYFAFEVEDADVWARDTHRDDRTLPSDEVVEVFLDDGGDEVTYFEFEVSPNNVVQDLYCFVPSAPVDHDPSSPFRAMNGWNAPGLETGVCVEGTLDVKNFWAGDPKIDSDRGYVVEIALPWRDIAPYPSAAAGVAHRPVPPRPGDRWRLGLFRTELHRPRASADGGPKGGVTQDAARKRLGLEVENDPRERFERYLRSDIKPGPDGLVPRRQLELLAARRETEYQAWAPTHQPSFHVPSFFGVLEFKGE